MNSLEIEYLNRNSYIIEGNWVDLNKHKNRSSNLYHLYWGIEISKMYLIQHLTSILEINKLLFWKVQMKHKVYSYRGMKFERKLITCCSVIELWKIGKCGFLKRIWQILQF